MSIRRFVLGLSISIVVLVILFALAILFSGCGENGGDGYILPQTPKSECGPNQIVPCLLDDWGPDPIVFEQFPGECDAKEYLYCDGTTFALETVFPFEQGCTWIVIIGWPDDCQHGTIYWVFMPGHDPDEWEAEGTIEICGDILWISLTLIGPLEEQEKRSKSKAL